MASEFSEDIMLDLLEEALQAGLIAEEGNGAHISYRFWHPLIVNHLYTRISAARRALLHRRAAEAIKGTYSSLQQERASAIVYHLCHGGGDLRDIALYADQAGRQAYAITAYSEALRHFLREIQALLADEVSRHALYSTRPIDIHTQLNNITSQAILQTTDVDLLHICHLLELVAECSMAQGYFADTRYLYQCVLTVRGSQTFQQQLLATQQDQPEAIRKREAQIQALLWREIGRAWSHHGEYPKAHACYERARQSMSLAGVRSGTAWACVQIQYGDMLRLDGRHIEAESVLIEALAMLDSSKENRLHTSRQIRTRIERALLGDPREIGYGHERLGIVAISLGQTRKAFQHLNTALTIYEKNEILIEMGRVQGNLGAVHTMLGEYNAARTHLQRALKLVHRTGDLLNTSLILQNLGDVAYRTGNLLEAEQWLLQSVQIGASIGYRERQSSASVDLAAVQQNLGKLSDARTNLLQALRIARAIGNTRTLCYALVQLGELRQVEAAIACNSTSLEETQQLSHTKYGHMLLLRARATLRRVLTLEGLEQESVIEGKYLLAASYYLLNDLEEAEKLAHQALQEALDQGSVRTRGRTHRLLGHIAATRGNYQQAFECYEQALQIFQASGLRIHYARTLHSYGATLYKKSPADPVPGKRSGEDYLREARAIFKECNAELELAWVEHALNRAATPIALTEQRSF
jgi:tetratricopeptide (TPR) repeat protein